MDGAILILIWAGAITVNCRLISLENFEHRIQLPHEICCHSSNQYAFEVATHFRVFDAHDHDLLQSFTVSRNTAYTHEDVKKANEEDGPVDVTDEKVLVSAGGVESGYYLHSLVTAPLLANAVQKVWVERVHPGNVFSLWSFVVLDLQLLGQALTGGLHVRVVGEALISGYENRSHGRDKQKYTKHSDPRELLVVSELTKREDGGSDRTIVEAE